MSNFNPAPNFNILSYANTWGDLVTVTNKLVQQNNDLASNNFTKAAGTLYLTDPTLGLQVNNSAIFAGQLQSVGTGSSVLVDNNLTVRYGQVYFSNTTLGLTNSGQANINGPLLVNGPNTGLFVANTANVYGKLNVSDNALFGNTVIIRGNTYVTNTAVITGNIYTYAVQANNSMNTATLNAITGNFTQAYVGIGGLNVLGPFVINGDTVYNNPNLVLSGNVPNPPTTLNPGLQVYRTGTNANIRWNETSLYWDTRDVINGQYYRILSDEYISDSISLASSSNVASSMAVNILNNNLISNVATLNSGLASNVASLNSSVTANAAFSQSSYNRANTALNQFVGTTGTISPPVSGTTSSITFNSNNGVTVGAAGNTLTVSTSQDLRTSASPTFAGVSSLYQAIQTTNAGPLLFIKQQGSGYSVTSGNAAIVLTSDNTAGNPLLTVQSSGTTTGYLTSLGNLYLSGTLYDNQNTNYYVKPSGTSNLYYLNINNAGNTPARALTIGGGEMSIIGQGGASPSSFINIHDSAGNNGQNGTLYIRGLNGGSSATLSSIQMVATSSIFTGSTYVNATMYDGANNTYYVKPSGTSNLLTLITNSQIVALGNQSTSVLTASGSLGGIMVQGPGASYGAFMSFHRPNAYAAYFGIDTDDNFTVGGWSAGAAMARMKVGSFGVGTAASGTAGEIRATNQIVAYYSDENLKTKLGNIEDALDKVMSLNGFYYEANETAQELGYQVKREVGVSAQEVQKVLPEVVVPAPIDDKYLTVHYERIVPLLIEAIKELKTEVEELKKQIKS